MPQKMENALTDSAVRLAQTQSAPARSRAAPLGLVGDVGGTNARFALAEASPDGLRLTAYRSLLCADHDSLESALHEEVIA